jgi:hypothetical protein
MIPNKYVVRRSREQVAGKRDITVRKFNASTILQEQEILEALEKSRLVFGKEFGVIKTYGPDSSESNIRALCGLVGDRNLILLNEQNNELNYLKIKHVLLATMMLELVSGSEAGELDLLVYGGKQGRIELWNMLRENFGVEGEPSTRRFSDAAVRTLCEEFFDRLFQIEFDPLNQSGWGTISAADFKSGRGQYIDPEVDRMQQVRHNTEIVIHTFKSELRNQSVEPLEDLYNIRFRLLKDSGVNMHIPELRLPPGTDEFEREMVFYDLAQQSYRRIVGTEELYEPLPPSEQSDAEQLQLL